MVSPNTQKMFIIAIVLFFLGVVGYKLFTATPEAPVAVDISTSNTEIAGQDILTLVEKLKTISIDEGLFSSSLFNNLKDYSLELIPELPGRINPFALIGSDYNTQPTQSNKVATSSRF